MPSKPGDSTLINLTVAKATNTNNIANILILFLEILGKLINSKTYNNIIVLSIFILFYNNYSYNMNYNSYIYYNNNYNYSYNNMYNNYNYNTKYNNDIV